jgi:hypothetical protein
MDTRPAMTVGQSHDDESAWALDHAEDVALEATGGPWPDILDEYGSMDVWLDHCRRQRHRDGGDRSLARVVLKLMTDAPGRPRGTLYPADRTRLLADPELAAYFASVIAAGDMGWQEERTRIRNSQRRGSADRAARDLAPETSAIAVLMETWRQWGAVLLEAGAVGDLNEMFAMGDCRM